MTIDTQQMHRIWNGVMRAACAPSDGVRLIRRPVFLLSSVRSGSTLLRSILNSHTAVCAPHELHLATFTVDISRAHAVKAWQALDLSAEDLQNVLWDRALHLALVRSGKRIIVDKTPQNARSWQRIHAFWPEARYVHLRRHPAVVLNSVHKAQKRIPIERHIGVVQRYGEWLDAARLALPGPTIRYEDLSTDPEPTIREVCSYLGVRYQARMLDYEPTNSSPGLGDWSAKIRSGRIQPHEALPTMAQTPVELRDLARRWGY